MKRRAVLALCVVLAAIPAGARAADDEGLGVLHQLTYSLNAGAMLPAGQEGEGLDPGGHAGGSIHYESGSGLSLGGELQWNRSSDPLRTKIYALSAMARISPRDYTALFMRLGFGAYYVRYDPRSSQLPKPDERLRPGGSFGVGFELVRWGKVVIGGSGVYHGILLDPSDALSYLTATVDLTWRPFSF